MPKPTVTLSTSSPTPCIGEVVTLSVLVPQTFSWSGGAGSTANSFTYSSPNSGPVTFSAQGTGTNGCCNYFNDFVKRSKYGKTNSYFIGIKSESMYWRCRNPQCLWYCATYTWSGGPAQQRARLPILPRTLDPPYLFSYWNGKYRL